MHLSRFASRIVPPTRVLVGLGVATAILLICTVVIQMLVATREAEFRRASIEVANLSNIVTKDIERNIDLYDLSITGAVETSCDPAVMAAPTHLRQLILFDRAATAAYLGKILVLDADGKVLADSSTESPNPVDYADRDYFRIHRQRADFGLYVSRPLQARSDGGTIVAMSRRRSNPDGSFAGVVVGTLRLEYFHQLFAKLRLGSKGSLTLFRNDGSVLMREPFDPAITGMRVAPPQLFDLAHRFGEGEYQAVSTVDGIERLYHYNRVAKAPLIQNVGFAIDDIYAAWWRRAETTAVALAACCALIIGLTAFLVRELDKRTNAESILRDLAERDGLTGIPNRRCFDRALATELQRSAQGREPLSLLMLDADHFKSYNDTFGHGAGDAALKALATCLAERAKRTGDLPARLGGEEFAILLPATTLAGASKVAEDLRQAVRKLAIPHPGGAQGVLSVSIGVATNDPLKDRDPSDLMIRADKALYRAKTSGRDQVVINVMPDLARAA